MNDERLKMDERLLKMDERLKMKRSKMNDQRRSAAKNGAKPITQNLLNHRAGTTASPAITA